MSSPGSARSLAFAASLFWIASAGATPALAQLRDVTVPGLVLPAGPTTYRLGDVTLRGTTLSPDDAARFFSGSAAGLRDGLARLDAAEIAIPQIVADATLPGGSQTTIYRDVVLRDVRGGRIGQASSSGGTTVQKTGERVATGSFGRVTMDAVDLPFVLSLYEPGSDVAKAERSGVYGAVAIDALEIRDATGQTVRVGRIEGRDFRARRTAGGLNAALQTLSSAPPPDAASPDERRRTMALVADLFDSFAFGTIDARDLRFGSGDPAASGVEARSPAPLSSVDQLSGRIARLSLAGSASGGRPTMRIEGVDLVSEGSRARVGAVEIGGDGSGTFLSALAQFAGTPPDAIGPADLRALVPPSGTVRLTDLAVETGTGPAATRMSLASLEGALERPVEGLPSTMRLAFAGLDLPVRGAGSDEGVQALAALGYDRLKASFSTEIGWSEPAHELTLRDLTLAAPGLGRLTVNAVLGGVSKDVFSPDPALASIALVGASATALDITVENGGMAERMLDKAARDGKVPADEVRRNYGLAAAIGIPALLGNAPAARTLGQAVARFVAKPGRLVVKARAKDRAGLAVTELLAAASDPAAVLDRLTLTATNE